MRHNIFQRFSKKKYNRQGILDARAQLNELKPLLDAAKADVAQIEACVALAPNDPTRTEVRLDTNAIKPEMSDFYLARCAQRLRRGPMLPLSITSWSARPCTSTLATGAGLRYQVFFIKLLLLYQLFSLGFDKLWKTPRYCRYHHYSRVCSNQNLKRG